MKPEDRETWKEALLALGLAALTACGMTLGFWIYWMIRWM